MNKLVVLDCFRFGWATFKKRPWILIGALLLTIIAGAISSALFGNENQGSGIVVGAMILASVIVNVLIEIGFLTFFMRAHDSIESAQFTDLWNPTPFVWYLVGQVAVGIIVIIGLVLLIVPGLIAAVALFFTSYFIIEGKGPIEAIKASWEMTKGNRWKVALLLLAVAGLNLAGFLAFVVGLVVTVPISMLALVHAYRTLGKGKTA
jgi:uncharacterized membrane protein